MSVVQQLLCVRKRKLGSLFCIFKREVILDSFIFLDQFLFVSNQRIGHLNSQIKITCFFVKSSGFIGNSSFKTISGYFKTFSQNIKTLIANP